VEFTNTQPAPAAGERIEDFVPAGNVIVERIFGDLNGDGQEDVVFITRQTEFGNRDQNRRGIIIAFKKDGSYELVLAMPGCFAQQDQGSWPHDISVEINGGRLFIHLSYGRYGSSHYNFRHQNNHFELIGYDNYERSAGQLEKKTSINFVSKKMQITTYDGEETKTGETWHDIEISTLIRLRDIREFDNFVISNFFRSPTLNVSQPLSTVHFVADGSGFIQFSTNRPEHLALSWWNFFDNINHKDTFEIETRKISGAGHTGYGMVFGASNSNDQLIYGLEINTQGSYCIYFRNYANVTWIRGWTRSHRLNTGYNVPNTLRVVRNGSHFTVYLNDHEVFEFIDSTISGDRMGFVVVVGHAGEESFPNTPVDVRYRQR